MTMLTPEQKRKIVRTHVLRQLVRLAENVDSVADAHMSRGGTYLFDDSGQTVDYIPNPEVEITFKTLVSAKNIADWMDMAAQAIDRRDALNIKYEPDADL